MRRGRTIDALVVWTLSILLAAIFVVMGIPKLLGTETIGLQAAAMRGFPSFIRIAVGVAETVGGIALLLPPIATTAAICLAAAMVPATITQIMSGEAGVWVPIVLCAALLYVAWRRNAELVRAQYAGFRATPHPMLYEGVVAGSIGALAIALWFLAIDAIAGHPFFTPATLGHGLLSALGFGPESYGPTIEVLAYTAFHFAAFMFVGVVASAIVYHARRQPSTLFAFVLLFAVTEVGIYTLVSLLHVASPLGRLAWLQIMIGNVIAALAMGVFFLRRHRDLGDQFRRSLDWDAVETPEELAVRADDAGHRYRGGAPAAAGVLTSDPAPPPTNPRLP
jgi:uncharacterized membrane protein YphA (DoxX/SURF4 family)